MDLRLRINGKVLLYILGTTVLVYISALIYAAFQLRSNSYENAHHVLEAIAIEISDDAQAQLNSYIDPVIVLTDMFANYKDIPEDSRADLLSEMLNKLLEKNLSYSAVATVWEPGYIKVQSDTSQAVLDVDSYKCQFNKIDDELKKQVNVEFDKSLYQRLKTNRKPLLLEPFEYSYGDNKEILISRVLVPIIVDDTFLGMVSADIPMLYMQQHYSKLHPMENGLIYIATNKGVFLSHPFNEFYGKSFGEYAPEINNQYHVDSTIALGKITTFSATEPITNEKCIFSVRPIQIQNIDNPWSFVVSIPLETIYFKAKKTIKFVLSIGLIGFIFISIVIWLIARSITKPIVKTTNILQDLSRGNIKNNEKINFIFNDEINDMAQGMNQLVEGLISAAEFAQKIGEGHLDVDYKLLGENDALGESLISMRESLKHAKQAEEQKRTEDEKRNWVTHGLAKFGEVIRQHNDNMERFTLNIVQNLVDYMGVTQVAMYVHKQIEDEFSEEDSFELKALMAYGKVVKLNKSFKNGQELLGRTTSENRIIYMEELPVRYVLLSPGMQDKKRPTNLIIAPISINDVSLGVIEILSYNKFETHEVEFIEKLTENIASVVASVKTNLRTEKLLDQSQNQADELAQHEEEMRQNLEEMEATQEEANKRQEALKSYLKAVKGSIMLAELDLKGRIMDISPAMSVAYGASTENMRGKFYDAFVAQDKQSQEEFNKFWQTLLQSGSGKRMQKFKQRNKEVILLELYKVVETEGVLPKVVIVAIDKTLEKELNEELAKVMKKYS